MLPGQDGDRGPHPHSDDLELDAESPVQTILPLLNEDGSSRISF